MADAMAGTRRSYVLTQHCLQRLSGGNPVATTRSRPRGRESARPSAGGVATEHASKIYGVVIGGTIVIIAFLALTSIGHVIDAATQRFMLYYAGVFTLIALCASVGLGLVATDRMILNPGHRIFVQSAHRAASFGALAFLVIHIVTEILAQRVHALDAFVPFLSPFRTFYIGLGTIASDLILLLVITGIMRKRFRSEPRAARPCARRFRAVLVAVPHFLHRPRDYRLRSHPVARYNGHHAQAVQIGTSRSASMRSTLSCRSCRRSALSTSA